METGSFDHANEDVWPTPRLLARLQAIAIHLDSVKLSQERIHQLDLESDCLAFELKYRDLGRTALNDDCPTLPFEVCDE